MWLWRPSRDAAGVPSPPKAVLNHRRRNDGRVHSNLIHQNKWPASSCRHALTNVEARRWSNSKHLWSTPRNLPGLRRTHVFVESALDLPKPAEKRTHRHKLARTQPELGRRQLGRTQLGRIEPQTRRPVPDWSKHDPNRTRSSPKFVEPAPPIGRSQPKSDPRWDRTGPSTVPRTRSNRSDSTHPQKRANPTRGVEPKLEYRLPGQSARNPPEQATTIVVSTSDISRKGASSTLRRNVVDV